MKPKKKKVRRPRYAGGNRTKARIFRDLVFIGYGTDCAVLSARDCRKLSAWLACAAEYLEQESGK